MSFSALDRYYVNLFEVNLDFLFFIVKKRLHNMVRQHTIPWNKVCAVPSILHTVGVNWNSRSEIDTAYSKNHGSVALVRRPISPKVR